MRAINHLTIAACIGLLFCTPAVSHADKSDSIPLKESIEAMMRNNHSLRGLQENREAGGYDVDRAKAGWGPRVDLQARGGFGRLSDNTTRSYKYDDVVPYTSASLILPSPCGTEAPTARSARPKLSTALLTTA